MIKDCSPKRKLNPETLRLGEFHQFPFKGQKYALSFKKKKNKTKGQTHGHGFYFDLC